MTQVDITVSPDIADTIQSLEATSSQLQRAAIRALNKTARWLRTRITKETAEAFNIKQSLVRKTLVLVRAKRGSVQATVGQAKRTGALNAIYLGQARQQASGVRVARRHYDKAFIATMPRGFTGVFRRKPSSARLPIMPVQIVITGKMADVMERLAEQPAKQQFNKLFERELRFILRYEQR